MATHSSILAWKMPWTDKPGGPWGCKELDTTEHVYTHTPPRVPDLHFDPPTVVSGEGFNFGSHTAVGGSHRSKLNHLERASRV